MKPIRIFALVLCSFRLFAQDDLMKELEKSQKQEVGPVHATFKATRLVNGQTIETKGVINSATNLGEQEIAGEVLLEKYAKGDEKSVTEVRRRVARALALVETESKRSHWERQFLWAQENGFVPAGRINSAAGTDLTATLINCFVQPVGDSITEVVDGRPGIYTALAEAAETISPTRVRAAPSWPPAAVGRLRASALPPAAAGW